MYGELLQHVVSGAAGALVWQLPRALRAARRAGKWFRDNAPVRVSIEFGTSRTDTNGRGAGGSR